MPYFKDTENKLHFLDDASFVNLLPSGSVQITDEEYAQLTAPKPETADEVIARLEGAVDRYLDEQAQSLRYESIKTIVGYDTDPNPKFRAEGIAGKNLRSACYTLSIELIDKVQSGIIPVPTETELIAMMPKITDYLTYES